MVVPLLGSLIYFVAYAGERWARVAYVLVKVYTVLWPVLATRLLIHERLPRPELSARRHRRAVLPGLVVGSALTAAGLALMASPLGELIMAHSEQVRLKVGQLGVMEHYLAFALVLSFVHSGIEEIYWRWFVFGTLRRLLSIRVAAVLASLAFASHHVVILGQYFPLPWAIVLGLTVALGGYMWCLMYQRQRTLMGAWMSHILLDLLFFWIGHQMLF